MDRQKQEFVDRYSLEEIMPILTNLVRRYTAGDSTSVTYETGQELMEAVRYTINQIGDTTWRESPLPVASGLSATEAYGLGHRLLVEKRDKAQELYEQIMKGFNSYGSLAYYDTLVLGMPEFFKWYDVDYSPQSTILMLDYPLEEPINDLAGIDMIYAYLQQIEAEQSYLSKFPPGFVAESLQDYHFLGGQLVINLTYVLKNMGD